MASTLPNRCVIVEAKPSCTGTGITNQLEAQGRRLTWPYHPELRYIAYQGDVWVAHGDELIHDQMIEQLGIPPRDTEDLIRGFITEKDLPTLKERGGVQRWVQWQYPNHFTIDAFDPEEPRNEEDE